MLSSLKNIIRLKFDGLKIQSESSRLILVVFVVLFTIFYTLISLKDTGSLDFKYIFSYWVDSFSFEKVKVFIKYFQIVRLFSVFLNTSIMLIIFLTFKSQLKAIFLKIWLNTISLFKYIFKKFFGFIRNTFLFHIKIIIVIKRYSNTLYIILVYLISLLPVIYLLTYLNKIQTIPNNDYWGYYFMPVFGAGNLREAFVGILSRGNEHIMIIPNLIYSVNFLITRGNNLGLFVINIVINLLALITITKLFIYKEIFPKKYLIVAVIMTSMMFFSPNMTANWVISMSGVAWFLSNTLFIFNLCYCYKMVYEGIERYPVKWLLLLSFLSVITYSTGLVVPIVISTYLLVATALKKLLFKDVVIYPTVFIIYCFFWVFFLYRKPPEFPSMEFDLLNRIDVLKAFFGNGIALNNNLTIASTYGSLAILLFLLGLAMVLYKYYKGCDDKQILKEILVLFLSLYALINGIMVVIARVPNNTPTQVLQYRYVNLVNLFWLGLVLYYFLLIIHSFGKALLIKIILIVQLLVLISIFIYYPMYKNGSLKMNENASTYKINERLFKLGFETGVYDKFIFEIFINLDISDSGPFHSFEHGGTYTTFLRIKNAPYVRYHYPFNAKLTDTYGLDTDLDSTNILSVFGKDPLFFGDVEKFERLKRNTREYDDIPLNEDSTLKDYKISGYVCIRGSTVKKILVADSNNKIKGAGLVYYDRPDIEGLFGDGCLRSGFVAYIREAVPGAKYSIFLILEGNKNYYFKDVSIPLE